MMEEPKTVEDLMPIMLDYPFVYKGMTIEKYEEEKAYWGKHLDDFRNGSYKPLWVQNGEQHEDIEWD